MKIIVYNHSKQYALSRSQVESIKAILPKEYFAPINEFHLLEVDRSVEIFEYSEANRIAYFSYAVDQKTPEIVSHAIKELLIGLARIKGKSKFFHKIKKIEKDDYLYFVSIWHPKCVSELCK
jgi:hypothetical protein